jgi:hypothetical protein
MPMARKLARLELDFSPTRRNAPLGWLLLAAGLGAATLAGVQFQSAHAQRLAHAGDLSLVSGRLADADSAGGPALDARAAKAAAVVARELQTPWADLLAALESVPARDVALLGVEPSPVRHVVRITAEAKTTDAMLDYVDALRGKQFTDIWLMSHTIEAQTPGAPTRFIVQLKWNGR